jgi:hypothetical protein
MKKKNTVMKASVMDPYLLKRRNISLLVFLSFMWLYLIFITLLSIIAIYAKGVNY